MFNFIEKILTNFSHNKIIKYYTPQFLPSENILSSLKNCDLNAKEQTQLILKGVALGDCAGRRYEGWFQVDEVKRDLQSRGIFNDIIEITDDTILTFATYDSLLNTSLSFKDAYITYVHEYPSPSGGYGGGFIQWAYDENHEPYNSCGNGSAMRVAPCACVSDNVKDIISTAITSAMPTHNHPEGIKGAAITAVCVWLALHNASKNTILNYALSCYTPKNSLVNLNLSLSEISDEARKIMLEQHISIYSICQGTVPMAIRAFCDSSNYEDCLKKAIELGYDTDTQAAIAGSIAAAYYKTFSQKSNEAFNIIMDKYPAFAKLYNI